MFVFCKPAYSRKRFLPHRELNKDYNFSIYENATAVPAEDWDAITKNQTVFLDRQYLAIAERGGFSKMMCRYVLVFRRNKVCGIIYYQVIDFKAGIFGDLFSKQVEKSRSHRLNIFEKYVDSNRDEVLLRLVTCGNNLVSGPFGFLFSPQVPPAEANEVLLEITDIIAKEEKLKGGISAVLIKDFHEHLQPQEVFKQKRYSDFNVEPNLIVNLPREVKSIDDYITMFSKKYRNRAKSVMKACQPMDKKVLSLDEIRQQEKDIYKLYEQVFDKARFRLIKLPSDYFSSVKALYGDRFTVRGFYKDGKMLAFASSMVMANGSLEAHYIGFDYTFNNELCLYQNILLSMIHEGISNGCHTVNLGRTAAEIKTTVGAKPYDLICYIKPQNTISKIIQKPFISFLQPGEWTPRNPFKEEGQNAQTVTA